MVAWAVLLLTATVASAAVPRTNRIVGGEPTTIEQYPSIVQMDFLGTFTGTWSQSCAGSILTPRTIGSAAHCTYNVSPSSRRIRAGTTNRNNGGTIINVDSILNHPEYRQRTNYDADMCLLFLAQELSYNPAIQPVSINAQNSELPDGSAVVHAGWGHTSSGGSASPVLRDVTIYTINNAECARRYRTGVTENMICAGILDAGGKDACQGDSGGPLYFNNILVGMVSWGRGCADSHYPGISTKVASYSDWIKSNAV